MTAIVTSLGVIAVVLVGVIAFVAVSLMRRRNNTGTVGLDEAEGVIREAIAATAVPRVKAQIVRRAA